MGSFRRFKDDDLTKSRIPIKFVIPAEAGIQFFQDILDPGFRRGDNPGGFLRDSQGLQGRFMNRPYEQW
jgi:hypothetical protein